jgi:hypothetical protein
MKLIPSHDSTIGHGCPSRREKSLLIPAILSSIPGPFSLLSSLSRRLSRCSPPPVPFVLSRSPPARRPPGHPPFSLDTERIAALSAQQVNNSFTVLSDPSKSSARLSRTGSRRHHCATRCTRDAVSLMGHHLPPSHCPRMQYFAEVLDAYLRGYQQTGVSMIDPVTIGLLFGGLLGDQSRCR